MTVFELLFKLYFLQSIAYGLRKQEVDCSKNEKNERSVNSSDGVICKEYICEYISR